MGLELNFSANSGITELKKLQKELKKTGSDTFEIVKDLNSLKRVVSGLASSFKKTGSKESAEAFSKLEKEITDVIESTKVLKSTISDSGKKTGELVTVVNKSSRAYTNAKKEVEKYEDQTLKAWLANDKQIKVTNKLESEVQSLKGEISKLIKENKEYEDEVYRVYGANYKYEKSLNSIKNTNKELGDSNRSLNGKYQTSIHQIKRLKNEIDGLNEQELKSLRVNRNLQMQVNKLTRETSKLEKEHREAVKTLKVYDRDLVSAWKEIERYKNKVIALNARIDQMNKKNRAAAYSINKVMKAASTIRNIMFLSTMAYSIQRLSNSIIRLGAEFEKTMTMVGAVTQSIGKGFTTGNYDKLIEKAVQLGAETEFSSNQAAEGMRTLALAGFSTRQVLATIPGVLDLATAGQVDLATASQLSIQALTAMGLKTADTAQLTENMTRVNDAFVSAATRTNTTVESIAEAFTYTAQAARNTGMEIEELTTYIGLLGNAGVQGSMAGTQLSFALSKQRKAMSELGMNPDTATFKEMLEEINKQGWTYNDIYKIFIQRGSRAVLALKDMLPIYERLIDKTQLASMSAQELAEIYRDTVAVNLQKVKSLIENIGIAAFRKEQFKLNESLKNFYDTLSDKENKEALEDLASLFVRLTSNIINFGSALVESLPKIVNFYKKNKELIDRAGIVAGGALMPLAGISGFSLAAGSAIALNTDLSAKSKLEIASSELEKINKYIEERKKLQEEAQSLYDQAEKTKRGSGYEYKLVGEIFSKDIEKATKEAEKYKKQIEDLNKEVNSPENVEKRAKEIAANQAQIVASIMQQSELDTKLARDMNAQAGNLLRESEEELDRLIGGDKRKQRFREGGVKFFGDLPIEDQMELAEKQIKQRIKNITEKIKEEQRELDKFKNSLPELQKDMTESYSIPPEGGSDQFEPFEVLKGKIASTKQNIDSITASINQRKEAIRNIEESGRVQQATFGFQISQREFERTISAQDKILDAEQKNYDLRKSLYSDFIKYQSSTFEKYIGQDIQNQIDAQKRSFEIFKRQQEFLAPDQRLTESEMTNLDTEVKGYLKNLEQYKTSQVTLGEAERKNVEIDNQVDILQKKYSLISGFSYKVRREQAANLKQQMDLEIEAFKNTMNAQEAIEAARMMNLEIPASEKMSEEEYDKWVKETKEKLGLLIKERQKAIDEITTYTKQAIIDDFEGIVESSIGTIFSDTLKGDLGKAEEYFSSFVNSLSSMWSQMAAKMLIGGISLGFKNEKEEPLGDAAQEAAKEAAKAAAKKAAIGTLGAMVGSGLALYGVSSIFSSREKRKAEKARKAALREQLEDELGDSLAQLKLSDTGYEIYQLNERIEELTKQAKDAGYPMKEIIELRKLETKAILDSVSAKYESVTTSMTDWLLGVEREDWGIEDWKSEYDRLHNDLLNLDNSSNNYQDDSIEILEKQFEALKEIYEIQKDQLNSLESLSKSLSSQIWDLQNTGNVPTSLDTYMSRYNELRDAAREKDKNNFVNEDAVQEFQDFVSTYLDIFSGAGFDYNELLYGAGLDGGVIGDLTAIQGEVKSEMEILTDVIKDNTGKLGETGTSLTDVKSAIESLTQITREIANRELYEVWKDLKPDVNSVSGTSKDVDLGGYVSNTNTMWYSGSASSIGATVDRFKELDIVAAQTNRVLETMDWARSLGGNVSDNVDNWIAEMPSWTFTGSVSDYDLNKDGRFSRDEWSSMLSNINKEYQDIISWANNIPAFAKGGWTDSLGYIGETGYGEYAVPDANNPNNSHFLKSVGVDSTEIGNAIGEIVASRLSESLMRSTDKDIVINLNGKEIARQTVQEIRRSPEYRKSIQ